MKQQTVEPQPLVFMFACLHSGANPVAGS